MLTKIRYRPLLPLLLAAGVLAFAGDEDPENPQYTFVIDGPCGETVFGPPGSTYDDGTLGRDLFFAKEPFLADADGDGWPDRKSVPNDRPGKVWDVVLKTSDPRFGGWAWAWSVGAEGALSITDVTTLGTVGCARFDRRSSECRRWSGLEFTALTGPPYGEGPQTEENHGAFSAIIMKSDFIGALRGNDQHTVGKLRVFAEFPETAGESVSGRVFFAERQVLEGPDGVPIRVPIQVSPFIGFQITLDEGNPPLLVEDCGVTFKAVPPVAAFVRCDPNGDGRSDLADAIWTFNELFREGPPPGCPESGDCNADGERNLSDAVFALRYQFAGGSAPPAPFPGCGRVEGLEPEDCPFRSTLCSPE